jgi:hypothetical protein
VGRKADLGGCHCLPFLRMPLGAVVVVESAVFGRELVDAMTSGDGIVGI